LRFQEGSVLCTGHERPMTTYTFRIEVEPDEDAWHAYCPALERFGAATWGATREEALQNIREVIELVISDLVEAGEHMRCRSEVQRERHREPRSGVAIQK
jgi:predicted RNase H-like HicB family nuclease